MRSSDAARALPIQLAMPLRNILVLNLFLIFRQIGPDKLQPLKKIKKFYQRSGYCRQHYDNIKTGSGSKMYTYVPAGGLVFPRQTTNSGQPSVEWSHRDPSELTEGMSAFDPMGNQVGHATPPQGGQNPISPIGGPNWNSLGSMFAHANNYASG